MEVVGNGFKLAVLALSLTNDFSMILIRVETDKSERTSVPEAPRNSPFFRFCKENGG